MSLLLRLLDTDSISLEVYGFWGCLRRRIGRALPYQLTKWWTKHVRTLYAPQHSNLRAAISKTWCDLDGCMESFLFACVVAFVEDEEGLKDWESFTAGPSDPLTPCDDIRGQQAAMLREVYNWAKTGRAVAEETMFASVPVRSGLFDLVDYTQWQQIENEMKAKTQRYLLWIVANRGLMWT